MQLTTELRLTLSRSVGALTTPTPHNSNMGKMILYGVEPSPPVRACKMTLAALELQYDYKLVNLLAGEHCSKDFMRKNPQHTVPMLEDDGHFLWDSHAINAYLVRKYGKTDELYPRDYLKRALCDQRLHFESGVLFQGCLRPIALPVLHNNQITVERAKINAIYEAYDFLESFLLQKDCLCGGQVTIADFSCIATVSSLVGLAPVVEEKHPRLLGWMERMSKLPYYTKANGNGAQMLIDMLSSKITKIVE